MIDITAPKNIRNSGNLSQSELFDRCVHEAEQINEIGTFKNWIRETVRPLLPHGALACVHGRIYGLGLALDYVVTIDYPVEHLTTIRNASGHMDSPLARRWFEQQSPIFFDGDNPWPDLPDTWLGHYRNFGLVNTAADGVVDKINCIATYFSFCRLPSLDEKSLGTTFQTLTPLLHETFARVIRCHRERAAPLVNYYSLLTNREQEIVTWISHGKSNSEIAKLLGVAENTIRNQVSRILDKTGCSNRAGLAVASILQGQHQFGAGTKIL